MLRLTVLMALASFGLTGAVVRNDIEFAKVDGQSLTLDASIPEGPGPFPAVIVVHGGGFVRGDKQTYVKPLFPVLTEANFAWFSINYRLAPKYPFPAAVEDVERAIQYVKSRAKQYKVDPQKIALVGESAGGYLVSYIGAFDKPASHVAAVVSFYGPHDLVMRVMKDPTITESMRDFWQVTEINDATKKKLGEMSPTLYVHKTMPPFLLIHGTADKQVPYELSPLMCEKMLSVNASCELFTIDNGAHGMGSWEKLPNGTAYQKKMVDWLRTQFAAATPAKRASD